MKPYFIDNLPMNLYHAGDQLSSSGLKELALSPAHYKASRNKPFEQEIIGTLTHMRVLEPKLFEDTVVFIEGHRGSKLVKAEVESAEAEGKIVCKPEEYKKVVLMSDAILAHPQAGVLFQGGVAERSFYWADPETGALCRCRADYFIEKNMIVSDIKYFSKLIDFELQCQIRKMKYDWSAAFYEDGIGIVMGRPVQVFAHVFVEEPRFVGDNIGVRVVTIDEQDLDVARREFLPLKESFAAAYKDQKWPSYNQEITTIRTLPRY